MSDTVISWAAWPTDTKWFENTKVASRYKHFLDELTNTETSSQAITTLREFARSMTWIHPDSQIENTYRDFRQLDNGHILVRKEEERIIRTSTSHLFFGLPDERGKYVREVAHYQISQECNKEPWRERIQHQPDKDAARTLVGIVSTGRFRRR